MVSPRPLRPRTGVLAVRCQRGRLEAGPDGMTDRPRVYVHNDHNDDPVRTFYEIPDALAQRIWDAQPHAQVFTQALAALVPMRESQKP